jgi:hypothetical protein
VDQLREQIESDLETTLEGDFGLPVELIAPDGTIYDKSYNDPESLLMGQILYDTLVADPDTGLEVIVHKPVVTLRKSSLEVVPQDGERWAVRIPVIPDRTADKETFLVERPTEEGGAIGFIRLYLMKTEQAAP